MSPHQVRLLRLRAQRLHPHPEASTSVAQIVKDVCGVQAQDAKAAMLAIGVRSRGLVAADVERALVEERAIVRTWAMRGTLHIVASGDVGWLLGLLGPHFVAADQRRRLQLGLDEDTYQRGLIVLRQILANGPLTREEIVAQMAQHGIKLIGQAAPHFLERAALEGIVCYGPERGGKSSYVLLADWVEMGKPLPREVALAELARRYLAAYAPAAPEDMAAWSGLPITEVRRAWQAISDELRKVDCAGVTLWMLKSQADLSAADAPIVRLLPAFDTYLLGYRGRDLLVERQYALRINAGGGMIAPTLLLNGQLIGKWRSTVKGKQLEVTVEPFASLDNVVEAELESEIAALGRFLEIAAKLKH